MDRSWIRKSQNRGFRAGNTYEAGVNGFLDFAFSRVTLGEKIPCPCVNCTNHLLGTRDEVFEHLIVHGIMAGYMFWSSHGEVRSSFTTTTENNVISEEDQGIVNMNDILHDAYSSQTFTELGVNTTNKHMVGVRDESEKWERLIQVAEMALYEWEYLKVRSTSEEWQEISTKNKSNREKQNISHTTGRKSFAQVAYEMRAEGEDVTKLKFCKTIHQRKDGSFINLAAREIVEKVDNELEKQTAEVRKTPAAQDTTFEAVIGKDRPERVHGAGAGAGVTLASHHLTQKDSEMRLGRGQIQRAFGELTNKMKNVEHELAEGKKVVSQLRLQMTHLTQLVMDRFGSQGSTHLSDN